MQNTHQEARTQAPGELRSIDILGVPVASTQLTWSQKFHANYMIGCAHSFGSVTSVT